MPLPQVVKMGPNISAANPAFIAASQTPVAGTPLTLTGASVAVGQRVLLTYGSEASARSLVITGTHVSGRAMQEILAVPKGASGTIATTEVFQTVTSAVPWASRQVGSGAGMAWTAAVTLGTDTVATSAWQIVDSQITPCEFTWYGVVAGTVNYQVQVTLDNPNNNFNVFNVPPAIPTPFTLPTPPAEGATNIFAAGAINAFGSLSDLPIYAWRILVNSGGTGSGDSVTVTCIQAGL